MVGRNLPPDWKKYKYLVMKVKRTEYNEEFYSFTFFLTSLIEENIYYSYLVGDHHERSDACFFMIKNNIITDVDMNFNIFNNAYLLD